MKPAVEPQCKICICSICILAGIMHFFKMQATGFHSICYSLKYRVVYYPIQLFHNYKLTLL